MEKTTYISLAQGQRNEITGRLENWKVAFFEGGPLVELSASAGFDPEGRLVSGKHPMATTLAIRMDQSAAIGLAERILALAHSTGL
jgi:hypothetical protein